ncbi:hypothetical protein L208DRAFT_1162260, partial [Tricholoma matsutake]
AHQCKTRAGGVHRFQDKQDKLSTANLHHHAIKCFGHKVVENAQGAPLSTQSGSMFMVFAWQGKKPVHVSHHSHTNPKDCELQDLLTTGCLHIQAPSPCTISCDIKALFERCHKWIGKLLQEHPGKLHFATDCWTSPNHHAFTAWTVHLEYNGKMLAFLLDIIELPEV